MSQDPPAWRGPSRVDVPGDEGGPGRRDGQDAR